MKELKISFWMIVLAFALSLFIKGVSMWWNIALLTLPQLHINQVGWKYVFDMLYSMLCGGYLLINSIKAIKHNWNSEDE